MRLIKNFEQLAINPHRKIVLEVIEAGLQSIQPQEVIKYNLSISNDKLNIQKQTINLNDFKRIFLLGFGKGAAGISKHIEKMLDKFLTKGYVIDVEKEKFSNIKFTQGTHPLPSRTNFIFTKTAIEQLSNLTMKDLVIVVIAGGGSALFEYPYKISLEKLITVNKNLLKSGANIQEMNIVRKHLSKVKGGRLARRLYSAKVISIIASDVPGNDLSVIASGPTVLDKTTKEDALQVLKKYNLLDKLALSPDDFLETPKENMYFENTSNILLLSNQTALHAMKQKAKELGYKTIILTDRFQQEAKLAGKKLVDKTRPNAILLAGGETTVKVTKKGKGGRNQQLVLAALEHINENALVASFDTDGWDNTEFAGAIGDILTIQKARKLNMDPKYFLEQNASFSFFEKVEDGIITGRLPSNVSDLMVVLRK